MKQHWNKPKTSQMMALKAALLIRMYTERFLNSQVIFFTSCFSNINTLLEDTSCISHFWALPIAFSTLSYKLQMLNKYVD